ncbi:MutS-related protein [Robertkochia flava]|uniref:MutS-related protein n=1 Tax=Robertkochia flava TaxID=3447986 RepID=UPI001CCFDDF3|nr:DNA mismatch repair protein MutS [Robertkochia marina]
MHQPETYYRKRLTNFREKHKAVRGKLAWVSVLRLLVFLTACILLYIYHDTSRQITLICIPGLLLFLILVNYSVRMKYLRNTFRELIRINQTEIDVLKGSPKDLDKGEDLKDRTHAFSHDIDLFGEGSFFQYCNRTVTSMGRRYFAAELSGNDIERIGEKQEATAELSALPDWRQEFMANAALIATETPEEEILKWIRNFQPTLPHRLKWLPLAWTLCSLAITTLAVAGVISTGIFIYWFVSGLILSGIFLSRISRLSIFISKSQDTFKQYQKLIAFIESRDFKSNYLREQKQKGAEGEVTASVSLKKLARMIDALDQRNNLLVAVLINPLGLADLYNGLRIEKWVMEHREEVPKWFEMIAFFDAAITKANFHFNHPAYCFPEINSGSDSGVIQAEDLGHPLIPEEKLVRNTVHMGPHEFMVVTGANMAGKSTFLRTAALFIVMSNSGFPVCAGKAIYRPIRLITSMRTADSLNEESSYFYAELKRLRFIVDALKEREYFIILDEILKGTNSKDKAMGSRKFVERLAGSGSTGIIATHDLSLCEVAKEIKSVKNYFFDAYIENSALRFDYRLRPGICTNMNASFLLDQMGIV